MYCHACGRPLPADAAFCPNCGTARIGAPVPPGPSTIHPAWIALLLVLFPPVGLILMWTSSGWESDVKWAISGIFFPPLWLRFLWKVPWLPYALTALVALLLLGNVLAEGLSIVAAVTILAVVAVLLVLVKPPARPRAPTSEGHPGRLRQTIEGKLDAINDLVADIEGTVALDLLPAGSALHERYRRALDTRTEALHLLDRAVSPRELYAVDDRANRALHELRAVRDGLADTEMR